MTDAYLSNAEELLQIIEQVEAARAEKQTAMDREKDILTEAKSRGYDGKILRKIVALRKRRADDVAEEEAIMELYRSALGM